MALKALMLRKKIDLRQKELEAIRAKAEAFETREAELEAAVNEVTTVEEQAAIDEEIDAFNAEKAENDEARINLEREIADLEEELAAEETEVPKEPEKKEEREGAKMQTAEKRNRFGIDQAFVTRENVQTFLGEVRSAMKDKRALTNVGLLVPTEFLGVLRANVADYSKLYKYTNVRYLSGDGRMVVQGVVGEAIWTECCANLNEATLGFSDVEVSCNKVGAYFAVCNALLEDSDIALADSLIEALAQGIGLALDKAILYGTGNKMPLGVVTRLAQTVKPADYPATAREWVNLSTTNIFSLDNSDGVAFFKELLNNLAMMRGSYSRGEKVWIMNETTYMALLSIAVNIDAAGAVVSGVNGQMPIVGGRIEVLNFIEDYVIIGGYFDLYLLAERASTTINQSEHARFIEDQTVFKGTARYDGLPVIAEAFVAFGFNGVRPTATMTFAPDTANTANPEG